MKYSWIVKPFFWFQKKKYGRVLPPMREWAKTPVVMMTFLAFYKSLIRNSSPLSASLRRAVALRVSQMVNCEFCIAFNACHLKGIKSEEVAKFQQSDLLSEKEKIALNYTEMMVRGHIDTQVIDKLKEHYSEQAIVELTALIGCQLLSSRFNTTLGIDA